MQKTTLLFALFVFVALSQATLTQAKDTTPYVKASCVTASRHQPYKAYSTGTCLSVMPIFAALLITVLAIATEPIAISAINERLLPKHMVMQGSLQ